MPEGISRKDGNMGTFFGAAKTNEECQKKLILIKFCIKTKFSTAQRERCPFVERRSMEISGRCEAEQWKVER